MLGILNDTAVNNICYCNPALFMSWSINLRTCTCNNTYYLNSLSKCVTCNGMVGVMSGFYSFDGECLCNTTSNFVWSVISKTCVCASGFYFQPSTKSCGDCSFVNGAVQNVTDDGLKCTCNTGITWNTTLLYCFCGLGNYPNVDRTCKKCSDLVGSVAAGSSNGAQCDCHAVGNFVWNFTTASCVCKSGYYLDATNKCVVCNGTGTFNASLLNKCNCDTAKTFEWSSSNYRCQCNSTSYLKADGTCALCSSIIGYDNNPTNGQACGCKGVSTWSSTNRNCSCAANATFINLNGECPLCSTRDLALGSSNKIICNCKNNSVWNTEVANCICVSKTYLSSAKSCLSCTGMVGAVTQGTSTNQACDCNSTTFFSWSPTLLKCVCAVGSYISSAKTCMSCSTVSGADSSFTSDGIACACASGISWNPTKFVCSCNSTSYITSSNTCQSCTGRTGTNANASSDGTKCDCRAIGKFSWNAIMTSCVCDISFYLAANSTCQSCTNRGNVDIVGIFVPNECRCKSGNFWDKVSLKCIPSLAKGVKAAIPKPSC